MNNVTIGMDLGDKNNAVCILDGSGKLVGEATVANTRDGLSQFFFKYKGATLSY